MQQWTPLRSLRSRNMRTTDLLDVGCRLLPVAAECQTLGLPASRSYFESFLAELNGELASLGQKISHRYWDDQPFNPNSDDQLLELLKRRGLKALKKTKKTKRDSVSEDSIGYLKFEDEAINDIFEWKHRQHIRDAFVKKILAAMEGQAPLDHDIDGDIFPVKSLIKPTRTATRRWAGEDPNPLNMPSRTKLGKRIRMGFVAPPGWVWGASDFSQIEPRTAAHVSEDETYRNVFLEHRDPYRETGAAVFDIPAPDITKDQRQACKTIELGSLYKQGAETLRVQLWKLGQTDWTLERCKEALRARTDLYPGLKKYDDYIEARLSTHDGWIEDMWGMKRCCPGIFSKKRYERAEAIRDAVNHTIQGGAQGMLQNSLLWLWERMLEHRDQGLLGRMGMNMHDEIVMLCPEVEWSTWEPLLDEALTEHHGVADFSVPVKAEGCAAQSWGELK